MKLNKIEFLVMNSPIRRFFQKNIDFKIFKKYLKKYNIDLTGKVILDAGCGSGYSSKIILEEFKPSKLYAFDFMPEQIKLAKKLNLREVNFFVGDITKIPLPPSTFDGVFVIGVLHHVPEWKRSLYEVSRVLKKGGVLLIEELSGSFVNFFNRLGFTHPKEARFEWSDFVNGMEKAGFKILEERKIFFEGIKSFICIKL
ncbi:class I SAM-dependent methyltransferase [Candidatus Aminicenantes bacterium AC-335-A11]|jgi:ubiquinone/menaquinone biosynthesis C-methylase UbiE|nr:class I SAM-dependent methyltransferase [SCandidatus Aminicenantes bacterium Aminicenantia_JdfR_composite]MCP2597311.1 class I SAM-dependent methyltransferase [Candidatus Aminicenantes bacterium AC-335-G13]MCP2598105.1 class I SAM-dependent methyltransferase [Candidatus Aminicenantes bacterium AC-335-L06]MCP2606232.1 class I SAM-dependent methyltransferase [Candidatus Aminicenantes bacterium AC-708-I09]MCP2618029.1 class I SAM-dependent methyltransferase [Candidatus Aminicenantes bacterium A